MAKITRRVDIRVEVYPDDWLISENEKEKRLIGRAESIAASIRRHVDDISSVRVIWDTEETCSFCGYKWETQEEDNFSDPELPGPKGMPLCCEEAITEFFRERE